MANNDSGGREKSDGLLPKSVLVIACVCMVAPVLALVAIPSVGSVEPNFAINILIAAATILTVIMVLVGLVLFSKLRDVKDEYDRICGIRDKAELVLEKAREKVEGALKEFDIKYEERERKAEGKQRKRLAMSEHFNKGVALLEAKKYDEAIAEFDECIRLDPSFAAAFNNRGFAKWKKGDLDGAVADYNEAIHLNPNYALAFNNRGGAKDDKGDFDGAIADYNKAIEINPKYAVAFTNRGLSKQKKGDLDGAIADYNEAIEFRDKLPDKGAQAYNNRGIAKDSKGDFDGAIADYNKAIEFRDKLPDKGAQAYNNRGIAKRSKGDFDGAIVDYNEAIHLDPNYAGAYYNLTCVFARKGEKEKAVEYLRIAVDKGFNNLEWLEKDPDLKSIREEPGYKEIVARLRGSK
jgi:tetratricopeptide (TPR) repeat protein